MQAERFIEFVRRKGIVGYHEAYKMIHIYFPDFRDFEGILSGAVNSGQVQIITTVQGIMLKATNPAPPPATVPSSIITPDTVM